MKKVGILTLDGIVNYGNRLQNYALQVVLEKEGCEADSIIVKGRILKPTLQMLRTIIQDPLKSFKFIAFNKKYIKNRYVIAKKWRLSATFSKKYDFFVVGSDQVWNPNIRKNQRSNYLLSFANPEQRIAIAASLSVPSLCEEDARQYKESISLFKAVSVREFEGAEIIKNLCGKDIPVLCDPTLMLSAQEWGEIAQMPKCQMPEKYLLAYFLGDVSKEREEAIKKYADAYNLEIVMLHDKKKKMIYSSGPREFLGLIKNATVVCTDSFHGTVFSSIFNVPFWAFSRESLLDIVKNMESRIVSLQKKLGISERLIDRLLPDMPITYDYTVVNQRIKQEQEYFRNFLRNALR